MRLNVRNEVVLDSVMGIARRLRELGESIWSEDIELIETYEGEFTELSIMMQDFSKIKGV